MRGVLALVATAALLLGGCGLDAGGEGATPRRPGPTTTAEDGAGLVPPEDQPAEVGDRDVADPSFEGLGDPRIDVSRYDVALRTDPDETAISGEVEITLRSTLEQDLPSFTLDLQGPEIEVATVDGRAAEVEAEEEQVVITPARALAPGVDVAVHLTYAGTPAIESSPVLPLGVGWNGDEQGGTFTVSEPEGTSTWMPVNDHLSDKATYRFTLDVPSSQTAVANGRLVAEEPAGEGRRRFVWEQDQPMAPYLALVAVGDYELVDWEGPEGVRTVLALPESLPDSAREGFEDIDDIIEFFSATFGAYHDDDAGAIVIPARLGFALETTSRPIFGLDAVQGDQVWALAHELAHEWYGNAVTPSSWRDLWLNEGFATYLDWMWSAEESGGDVDRIAEGTHESAEGLDRAPRDPEVAASFGAAVYERGALTLHALRRTVGDDAFFSIMRRWYGDHTGGSASTEDLVALASEVAGEDLTGFFREWLDEAPLPDLPS